jgi:hypothetical protein
VLLAAAAALLLPFHLVCAAVLLLLQAAPRDALIGDLSPAASRSACFGFAQSMRKWGSFMGAGLAFALMKASGNNYQAIFLLAAGEPRAGGGAGGCSGGGEV